MKRILVILCLLSFNSLSNEVGELFNLSIEDLIKVKFKVASRFEDSFLTSPSSVTVFTANEIERMGADTLEDLLEHVPSFVVSNLSDRKSLSVRGSKSYSQVLLLVDGQRQNEVAYGGFLLTRMDLSLRNVERVEVIRGPGSAIYGTGAFFGVINVTTKSGQNYAQIEVGTNRQKDASVGFSKKVGSGTFSIFSQIYEDQYVYDNFQDKIISGNGSTVTNRQVSNFKESKKRRDLQLKYKTSKFEFIYNYAVREFQGSPSGDANVASYEHNLSKPHSENIRLSYNLLSDSKNELNASLGYSKTNFEPFGYKGSKNGNDFFGGGHVVDNSFQGNLDYIHTFSDRFRFASGVEYRNEGIETDKLLSNHKSDGSYNGEIINLGEAYSGPRNKILGIYTQTQYDINKSNLVTAGLRFDDHSNFGSELSPRLAYIFLPFEKTSLKFMYGQAYRAPNYSEMFQDTTVVSPNKNLKAETIQTYEVALNQQLSFLNFGLTLYKTKIKDQINAVGTAAPFKFTNSKEDEREGGELELLTKLTDRISMRASYSQVFGLVKTDAIAPDHHRLGSLGFNWSHENFNFNVNGIYKKEIEQIDQNDLYIFNSNLEYKRTKDTKFYFKVKNLGNKKYLNTTFMRTNHQTNRGRTFSFGFKTAI